MIIGFDFGQKRIGIAVGNTQIGQASPLGVVRNIHGRPDWDAISQIVKEWQPAGFVVGLPLADDGRDQPILPLSNAFAKRLKQKYALPVYRFDERFSSIAASQVIADNRRRGKRRKSTHADTDKIAAAIILERWLMQTTSGND